MPAYLLLFQTRPLWLSPVHVPSSIMRGFPGPQYTKHFECQYGKGHGLVLPCMCSSRVNRDLQRQLACHPREGEGGTCHLCNLTRGQQYKTRRAGYARVNAHNPFRKL